MSLSQTQKSLQASKLQKKRLNQEQVRLLESSFDATKKLDPEHKFQLARELGVPPRQIAIWYQNKRARWKNQTLELDYGTLQLRLDAALSENKHLHRELQSLRHELRRTQDMLFGNCRDAAAAAATPPAQLVNPPPVSSLSSCCDEGAGSSSLNDSGNWGSAAGESLQFEELYACMMMGEGKGAMAEGVNYERDFWVE